MSTYHVQEKTVYEVLEHNDNGNVYIMDEFENVSMEQILELL